MLGLVLSSLPACGEMLAVSFRPCSRSRRNGGMSFTSLPRFRGNAGRECYALFALPEKCREFYAPPVLPEKCWGDFYSIFALPEKCRGRVLCLLRDSGKIPGASFKSCSRFRGHAGASLSLLRCSGGTLGASLMPAFALPEMPEANFMAAWRFRRKAGSGFYVFVALPEKCRG